MAGQSSVPSLDTEQQQRWSLDSSHAGPTQAKENDFKHFHSVVYINAAENLLPLEAFHTFPALKELDLAFNGIKTIYVKYGDFELLEFLDLSFNSLTAEAICDLGILPHLRVLLLTGNGLTSLPPNLAVAEQELVTRLLEGMEELSGEEEYGKNKEEEWLITRDQKLQYR
ncbi:X-ray radiation resistance-associated protein 1 [Saguinus oedipus]|uniref:X-ray radiation resistance-associated protein 1 n=1 Tax=Saguinus oedipus TaxID=9490 RepID=A0ABQ9UVZ3_SAGOE|nr:X-ray radiation resistance-associated protein 1 [Saguinus oedipus]